MPKPKTRQPAKTVKSKSTSYDVATAIAELRRLATKKTLDGMARYAIPADKAFGVAVSDIQKVAKQVGRNHELAEQLWKTGWYEARMLCAYLDEPERVTSAQMDRWCRDFDSWAIVDTICFVLFDRTPYAFDKIIKWSSKKKEFEKRAAFALLACVALHDKHTEDEPFAQCLPLIEKAATDERNFVKKGVSWALRGVGRRNRRLHAESVALAKRLAASADNTARWIGKDVLKDLDNAKLLKRLK